MNLIRERTLTEPLLVNRIISPTGNVTGVNITIQLPGVDEAKEVPEVVAFVRETAEEIRTTYPDMEVRLTGMVLMNNAFSESSKLDMQTLVPISFAVMLISLGLLIRGFTGTFVTLSVIGFSIAAAMGMGGFIGLPISPPSASSPIIILTVAMVLMTACATPTKTADTAVKGPAWVMKGSGAFDVEGGKVFYGVGAAGGIKNKALLRKTSDNRARAEIAQTLETYVAYLAKDYMASTTAGDMSKSSEEQHVEQALKTFTKATLHGAQIVDRWMDPEDGTYYSLCELDMMAFKDTLDSYQELDAKVRDYVRDNADRMHGELEELENQ